METRMEEIDRIIENNVEKTLEELGILCAQPSIAAQSLGMEECANLVANLLNARGFDVQTLPTEGFPVVFGERSGDSESTLLLYNHYDVQPPEPLELWESPPFEPNIREGKMFARGVSDDKGHILCRLAAIDALLQVYGNLPCRIKFVIEGEEEIGSIHLPAFIKDHTELLAGDACLWEFGYTNPNGIPIQYAGLRGICYVELCVQTASVDTHSGTGGSIFPNAAWRLIWALASLKDENEQIQLPDFYDKVIPPTEKDLQLLDEYPDPAQTYKQQYGVKEFLKGIEGGVELKTRQIFQPTCTVCGLTSGYQGEGSKTVLPAYARAKVDFRLVPDQHPQEVLSQLRTHLDANGFEDVEIEFLGGEPPGRTDLEDPFLQLVVETAREVYGVPQVITPMSGGSGPNHAFLEYLKVPVATAGIGYEGTNAHAPNENIVLDHFIKGAKHTARIIQNFSELYG